MMLRVVTCDVCGEDYQELRPGEGFPGWGQLNGIVLDGITNPYLCPEHLAEISNFLCALKEKHDG